MAYMPKNGGQDEENSDQRDDMEVSCGTAGLGLSSWPESLLIFYHKTLEFKEIQVSKAYKFEKT